MLLHARRLPRTGELGQLTSRESQIAPCKQKAPLLFIVLYPTIYLKFPILGELSALKCNGVTVVLISVITVRSLVLLLFSYSITLPFPYCPSSPERPD